MKGRKHSYKAKRGISTIIASIFVIEIVALSMLLIVTYENNQANDTIKTVQSLQEKAQQPLLYEAWDNGNTVLRAFQPLLITHVILPNGEIENTSLLLQNQIPITEITNGFPWAIIVTNQGTWYNITPIQLPGLIWDNPDPSNVSGMPWDSNVLKVSDGMPKWNALQGISYVNITQDPLPYPVSINGNYINEGLTDKEAVVYIKNNTEWINITYYAPTRYVANVPNLYALYYAWLAYQYGGSSSYLDFNPSEIYLEYDYTGNNNIYSYSYYNSQQPTLSYPYNSPYFYILLTTNPFNNPVYLYPGTEIWDPLTYSDNYLNYVQHNSGIWGRGGSYRAKAPINNPEGALLYNYTYVNATIGIYVPFSDTSTDLWEVSYLYIPFTDFEVTNLTAIVPSVVNITNGNPLHNRNVDVSIRYAVFENAIVEYAPYSWIDAPLSISPYTGNIPQSQANSAGIQYSYEAYPAHNYEYFPAYPIASPGGINGSTTSWDLAIYPYSLYPSPGYSNIVTYGSDYFYFNFNNPWREGINSLNGYDFALPYHFIPIMVYKLDINLNDSIILNYGYNPYTYSWILLSNNTITTPIGSFNEQYITNLPLYITIPNGTYLLAVNEGP